LIKKEERETGRNFIEKERIEKREDGSINKVYDYSNAKDHECKFVEIIESVQFDSTISLPAANYKI
jgi:hypothetical protein